MKRAAAFLSVVLSLLLAAEALLTTAYAQGGNSGIVLVQERQQGPGIFRFLFRNRPRQEPRQWRIVPQRRQALPREEERPQAARPRRQREANRPRRERRNRPAAPAQPEVAAVEKAANAKRVLVLGDFMAGALAKGLIEAYVQNPNVVVIDKSSGSSGLVRADFHDWPAQVPVLIEAEKPDAVLMLVGANDRQAISTEAGSQAIGSDGWRTAYGARVAVLADALKATGKPIFWAGLAPVRPSAMSRDYSTMNGIVREQLESRGLRYIDVWNGFANEEGRFVAAGPDIGGQSVQLRDSDGLNFTRAGQRKLAYFVEQELAAILGGTAPQLAAIDPLALPDGAEPGGQGPRIGPMVPIEALTTGGDALSAGPESETGASGAVVTAIARRLGGADPVVPPSGRIDSYAWPPPAPASATPASTAIVPAPSMPVLAGPPPALAAPPPVAAPSP